MSNIPRLIAIPLALAALGAFLLAPMLHAEEPVAPDAQKQKADDEVKGGLKKEPAPAVEVTDAAKPVVDKLRDAYAKLGGLQMSGTWSAQWDIDGDQGKESAAFTSSYAAPNKFRHEIKVQEKDDLLFGSTGEKAYGLRKNQYFTEDAPKDHVAVADLPKNAGPLLKEKDPSLLLAVTNEPTPFLADGATKIDKADDVKIGEASFTALKVSTKHKIEVTVLLDPATSLVRQWSVDMKAALEARGKQNVKAATMTIDYTAVKAEAPAGNEAFAWAPPAGAKDAAKMAAAEEGEAAALKGKPAPAFALKDLDGKDVKLADLKGKVVVLDFWATWCGPCRAGLPILDKVATARKDKGLKVFAVNLEEDKAAVAAFKKETKLGLDVLLDSTGDTGRAYFANAIPETVIIGKDGTVKQVMVGVHEQADLEKAIDEELK